MLRLARWVDMPIGSVTQTGERAQTIHAPDADTVQGVELHLRADKGLSGAYAEALADLFRIAYERFRIPREGDGS